MWLKNLVFIVLCVTGLAALAASLAPVHRTADNRRPRPDPMAADPMAANRPSDAEIASFAGKIDKAFQADWAAAQLTPAPPADDLTVVRRLSLGLLGAIPSLEEIRQFEQDKTAGRLDRWLENILNDRRCHDYLAERLTRAFVGVQEGPFIIYRRRRFVAWLTDQLAANRPYDEIVRQLLTDSGVWTDKPATNFITVTIKPEAQKGPDEGELAARVSRAFLGLRLDCAECHDHPFQPWKQRDFQGLAAFFGQTKQRGLQGIVDTAGEYKVQNRLTLAEEAIAPCVPFQAELLPKSGTRRRQLAAWLTHPENRAFARAAANRFWAELFGRPLVEPIDDIPAAGDSSAGDSTAFDSSADEPPAALELLAADFISHGYDLRRLIRAIAATRVFRLAGGGAGAAPPFEVTHRHEAA
ncbi:MAG TPA: DUF1549 domain-containing protein, partial [Pirellulales bacterium]